MFLLAALVGHLLNYCFFLPRLIRTSVLLTLTCCYLMWTVTYLAQVHPLERELAFDAVRECLTREIE